VPTDPVEPVPPMLPVDPLDAPLMLELEPMLPDDPAALMPSPATPRPALFVLPVLNCDEVFDDEPVDAPSDPVELEPVDELLPVLP
jgi:hypothetical protein